MSLQIIDPAAAKPNAFQTAFALGFRPFFLLAGLSGLFLIPLWAFMFYGRLGFPDYYGALGWHTHEMLFGYTAAVIAGFLLTAARNWTDLPTPSGLALALLACLWLAGRIAPFVDVAPPLVVMLIDVAFIPVVAISVSLPILRRRQWNNLVFLPLLLLMTVANILVHLQALNAAINTAVLGMTMMLYLIILIITIMAGRVVPFFTERGAGISLTGTPLLDKLAVMSVLFLAVADITAITPVFTAVAALLAGVIHLLRLGKWYSPKIWPVPIVWVLHMACLWLVIGMFMKALAAMSVVAGVLATHAFTLGGIGGITLGMMARVTIGHTGRDMKAARAVVVAFVLINLAALVRVFIPALVSADYFLWVGISSVLWGLSFALFLIVHAPMLLMPRVDGRPG